MDKKTILEKAIQKAIDGGWKAEGVSFISNQEFLVYLTQSSGIDLKWLKFKVNELIFNHDFAKALWGEDYLTNEQIGPSSDYAIYATNPAWKANLMCMVIADDPIQYLGEHLDG
jgi:hypothetical protein